MQTVNAVSYKLNLEPDLEQFTFRGRAEIGLAAAQPVDAIVLNVLDITIDRCCLLAGKAQTECEFTVLADKEEVHIQLPKARGGELFLEIDYEGHINDLMAGFYRSGYTVGTETRYIAVTQFQESDARRALPCLDAPGQKATFDISLDIPMHLTAISNEAECQVVDLANGKKRVVFKQTPKMSTYLVFFGVGEFDIQVDQEDPRVRTVTLPGQQAHAAYGLDFGRRALAFSEAYYGIDYPLTKMDLIAIPDFAFGAMENWGAITFRENLLLHYPEATSKAGEERICEVTAHEIAHQWFGNLVTPSDWKYLWLNESFATYFGFGVVAEFYPDWDIWDKFLHGQTATAMARDALHETFPIEIPGGEHVVINSSTAPIIYNKGGSILRQVQGYIGADNFQKGLRHYLKTHAYACAASHHLWEAFEGAADLPVTAMMQNWVGQPGFPMVTAERREDEIILTQQRFTYLPGEFDQQWLIPVTIDFFSETDDSQTRTFLMDDPSKTIAVPAGTSAYKLNSGQTGFFRVRYLEVQNLERLGQKIADRSLDPKDRWGLQDDLFGQVRSGTIGFGEYLDFIQVYKDESAYLVLTAIASNLSLAHHVLPEAWQVKIEDVARPWFERVLARIGYQPVPAEKQTTSILRDQLIWDAVRYGSEDLTRFAAEQFLTLIWGGQIHPDIMKSVMQAGARAGDEETLTWFKQRFETTAIEHERMNILTALGGFAGPEQIAAVGQYILEKVPPRNKFVPAMALAENPCAAGFLWQWYQDNLDQLEQVHPMIYERVIAAVISAAGLGAPDAVEQFFTTYMEKNAQTKDVISLSLERLKINLRMREKNSG
ncbi:MAG: M1 family metallopeptidase [Desulfobacterales bacterium]|nr:M1 family metallopeptidase [Desulfobacterales bacterium]